MSGRYILSDIKKQTLWQKKFEKCLKPPSHNNGSNFLPFLKQEKWYQLGSVLCCMFLFAFWGVDPAHGKAAGRMQKVVTCACTTK